ncbi:MAG TPA: ATP-binding protein [Cellvibrio sp.]|nr:ATP-binding protein [Cellvibrio sp.]
MSNLIHWIKKHFHFFSLINPVLVFAALAIALLFFGSNVALRHIHTSQERIIREHLVASLGSFSELINIWQQQNIAAIKMLAGSVQGKQLLQQVLLESGDNPQTHEALREWLYPILIVMGFDGFSVINHEYIIVAASSTSYIKQRAQLPETLEVLDKALANKPAISRPVTAVRPIQGPRGEQPAGTLMQNMCVLLEAKGSEPGYFCLRFNTHTSFFPIFLKGWTGRSSDIYAIDQHGKFITPARFGNKAHQLTIEEQRAARLGTVVSVPTSKGNAPLTEMVDFLINYEAALVRVNYPDYRGVAVAGAGRWIPEMELGIVVEQDMNEAMAPYLASRNIILGLTTGAAALILLLTLSAVANRHQLAIREGRFRSLLDNLPPPVHMLSMDHHLIVTNPAFCELMGLDKSDMMGRELPELPIPVWLKPLIDDELQCNPETCQLDNIIPLQTPTGEARYFRVVRFPVVYSRTQMPQAIASIWIDYTDRIVANQQLEAINQNLEGLVNERTHELVIAKDQALAASQSKAEFLANMSHEIRTPLNAIIGLSHVALGSGPDPRQQMYLEKIRGSGEHLLEIINDILNFSRMEAGKLELDHTEFFVDQLIDKSLDFIWEQADAKGLKVNVEVDPQIPRVLMGDPLRLGQILINFCANAVKFTDTGGIYIRVTQVRDWESRVELVFEVKDTGIGIAPEKIEQLFQPFLQVDSSSARRFEGTGLGLSICKNLAELMQGRIDVKSVVGQGSSFRLRVQLEKAAASEQTMNQPTADTTSERNESFAPLNYKILVVEDNPLNQEIILSLLERMGAETRCVDSGQAAILAVQHEPFDAVLMDIQLPGMDGVQATQHIRQLESGNALPIIAVTANALPGDKESYLAAGMDDYLSKPIAPAKLYSVVEKWGSVARAAQTLTKTAPMNQEFTTQKSDPQKLIVNRDSRIEYLQLAGAAHAGSAHIDMQRALHHLMDNEALYLRLLERFARERADFPLQLEAMLQQDLSAALDQVHSLKSLAGSLGMLELESIAQQLEEQLRNGEPNLRTLEIFNTELLAMVDLVTSGLQLNPKTE